MGILLLSVVISVLVSCVIWLAAGNLLPWHDEEKWSSNINILCYFAALLVPVYLTIFVLF